MEQFAELSMAELLAPIEGESADGSGEDLAFSLLFDSIKEARRADPTYLPQGEWQSELKQSDWAQVITLSSDALAEKSKDLQLAGWLCEGLAHRDGFEGIRFGLTLTARLVDAFWQGLHPQPEEEGDLDERAARLGWLGDTLIDVVRGLPLIAGDAYGLADYEESRQVENEARSDADAIDRALAEGKINGEIFQRSVVLSSTEFLQDRHASVAACLTALEQLDGLCDQYLGRESPGFASLEKTLTQCRDLVERLLRERGTGISPGVEADTVRDTLASSPAAQPDAADTAHKAPPVAVSEGALRTTPQSRDEAFEMLNGVARYFKEREPHSPVPFLVERAVKWGRMPLEDWLQDVISDRSVIDSIRDTLGTRAGDDDY